MDKYKERFTFMMLKEMAAENGVTTDFITSAYYTAWNRLNIKVLNHEISEITRESIMEEVKKIEEERKKQELKNKLHSGEITKEEIKELEKVADDDDDEIFFELGKLYQNGIGVEKDYKMAVHYYVIIPFDSRFYADAKYNLGVLYEKEFGMQEHYIGQAIGAYYCSSMKGHHLALQKLKEIAYTGRNPYAQECLGKLYYNGEGVKQNYYFAKRYFEVAALQGKADSNEYLGIMYENGWGGEQNYQKAKDYYLQAIKQGKTSCLYRLANMYERGLGVRQSFYKALILYEKAFKNFSLISKIREIELLFYLGKVDIRDCYRDLFHLVYFYNSLFKNDPYLREIYDKINNDSELIVIDDINNLTLDYLNSLDENSLIFVKPNLVKTVLYLFNEFYTVKTMKNIIKEVESLIQNIDMNQLDDDRFMQAYIKLGLLISNDSYHIENISKGILQTYPYNLITLIKRKGVCQGYAKVLKMVLKKLGIECIIIHSNTHAYNMVKIYGKWYYCDLTWDSTLIKQGQINYCLKSKEDFINCDGDTCESHIVDIFSVKDEHESLESYPDVLNLFNKNLTKILFKESLRIVSTHSIKR